MIWLFGCDPSKHVSLWLWIINSRLGHATICLWLCALQWRHNGLDSISNHQLPDCLLTGLCDGNSPVTGEFPAQRASNAENVSIWWCHHVQLSSRWSPRQDRPPPDAVVDLAGNHADSLVFVETETNSPPFPRWHLHTQIKENIKARRHWPFRGIHQGPMNSPHKGPVWRKMFHLMTSSWHVVIWGYFTS